MGVLIVEIETAIKDLEISAKQWDFAKEDPHGAETQRLAYFVIKHLRDQDPKDPRWAKHGRKQGCRVRPYSKTGANCKCPLWMSVLGHVQNVLKNGPRPDEGDESEEPEQRGHKQRASQTESDEEGPKTTKIDSSSVKKFKRPRQKNAPPSQNKRAHKQQRKLDEKQALQVQFSDQQVLKDSGNKAPNLQLLASGGKQMTFGKNQMNDRDYSEVCEGNFVL